MEKGKKRTLITAYGQDVPTTAAGSVVFGVAVNRVFIDWFGLGFGGCFWWSAASSSVGTLVPSLARHIDPRDSPDSDSRCVS